MLGVGAGEGTLPQGREPRFKLCGVLEVSEFWTGQARVIFQEKKKTKGQAQEDIHTETLRLNTPTSSEKMKMDQHTQELRVLAGQRGGCRGFPQALRRPLTGPLFAEQSLGSGFQLKTSVLLPLSDVKAEASKIKK